MSRLAVGSLEGLASEGYKITVAAGSKFVQAGSILQVVSTTKTDTFTTTANQTFTDITGLSATITPSATSSKILVLATVWGSNDVGVADALVRLMRDSTAIFVGDAAGNRAQAQSFTTDANYRMGVAQLSTLDSPNSTSSLTYKVQVSADTSATTYINRTKADTNLWLWARAASSITLMEVAG